MINITLENETAIELPEGSTARELAEKLNRHGPNQALAAQINGETYDLSHKLKDGDTVTLWDFETPKGKEVFWHTSAHVLAQAILRLWPEAQPTIGPPIEHGFYYDFANLHISEEDFEKIEKEMKKVISENLTPERKVLSNKEEALNTFSSNLFKCELIKEFDNGNEISAYQQGEFFDLCRGPHLPNIGKIKALKVLKTSGAYWRGDSNNEMLTRVYAITFPDRLALKSYLKQLEEAKKRDHKILGPKLDLFSLREEAPGFPFIHPRGMIVWNHLLEFWRELHNAEGYLEIKTPMMMSRELWEKSGHWGNYRDNMYTSAVDERDFAIKPMNCPGGMLHYKSQVHSYKEFPLRVAEIGHVHRVEASGAISGLVRVRGFHQDDAHIFMEPSQIEEEILNVIQLAEKIYSTFNLPYHLELSTKPEKETIGSDEDWEIATKGLQNALDRSGKEYKIAEGEGAFYGPKIDFHIKDSIGRTWQCGTIQLDMALPERFELEYTAQDGERKRPVMIHRALYGSLERFFAILIEHFSGKFPLWISPRQIAILTVADRHHQYANELQQQFVSNGFLCDIDSSHESVSKKIRNAQLNQYNYILTIGDQEVENNTINLRTRDNVRHGEFDLTSFLEKIKKEKETKLLTSPFSQKDRLKQEGA